MNRLSPRPESQSRFRIVLIYAVVAAIWIISSDLVVNLLALDGTTQIYADIVKGVVFVGITSVLLYFTLVRSLSNRHANAGNGGPRFATHSVLHWPAWTLYGLSIVLSLGTLGLRMTFSAPIVDYPLMIMMMFPITITAILGGFGPGMLATLILCGAIGATIWSSVTGGDASRPYLALQWTLLLINGTAVSLLAALLRNAWRRANAALADRIDMLQLMESIVENSSEVIFAKDTDGKYLLFNQAAASLFGKTPDQVVGYDDFSTHSPEKAREIRRVDEAILQDGQLRVLEIEVDTPIGRRTFLTTKGALRDREGAIYGVFGIAHDISERITVETALQESEQQLLRFIEHAPAALAMFDLDMRYLAASNRWIGDYELDREAVIGRSHYDIFPELPEHWKAMHLRAMAGENIHCPEESFSRRNGETQWIRWEVRPWYKNGDQIGGVVILSEDISEHKHAQAEQFLLSEALRQTAQPMLMCDVEGSIVFANTAFETLMGYTQVELFGLNIVKFVPEDSNHLTEYAALSKELRQVGRWSGEVERRAKNGTLIPMFVSGALVRGLTNVTERFVITYSDLRPLKQKIDELADSEARYRTLFEANPHPMWVYDIETFKFLAVNDAAINHYGYDRDEFKSMTIMDIRPPEDRPLLERAIVGTREGKMNPGIFRHYLKSGREIQVEIHAHRIRFDGRDAVVVLSNDVTQRLKAEQELRKLSQAIEQSPESVIIVDLESRVEYLNDAFTQNTGYKRDELLGKKISTIKSGRTAPAVYTDLWNTLKAGGIWRGEFINQRKDGSEYVDFAIISPIRNAEGAISHYVAIQEDITAKKKMANELDQYRYHLAELVQSRTSELGAANRKLLDMQVELELRARKAEAASIAKSYFLANMSHEIRTPMNAILGMAHVLKRSTLTAEQAQKLNALSHAGEHLLALLNDILDFSKIEAGKLVLEQIDIRIPSIIDGVRSLIAEDARRKGIEVTVDCADIPPYVIGDPVRLRQALLNFASNAVKFTEKGKVRLSARVIGETADDVNIRFEVQDSGIGIPQERIPDLFQSFQQLDPSTTRKHGGTGLGLAITDRLARLMGGQTGATSEIGHGSVFWLTARFRRSPTVAQVMREVDAEAAETLLKRDYRGSRILLVEDDLTNQDVALSLLHDAGLIVDVANNGEEAIEWINSTEYELILMDLQMPKMDGLAATRIIRAMFWRPQCPILAMTANVFDDDIQRCLAAGMNDFVPKPVDPEILFAKLLHWMGKSPVVEALVAPAQASPAQRADMPVAGTTAVPPATVAPTLAAYEALHIDLTIPARNLRNDPAKVARIVRKFLETTPVDVEKMEAALAADDWETLRALGHRLKSASRTVGALALAEHFECIERGDASSQTDRAIAELAAIRVQLLAIEVDVAKHPFLGEIA